MKCIISTPVKTITYDTVTSVTLPTASGIIQIKKGHAEYIGNLVSGEVTFTNEQNKTIQFAVQEGICRVANDVVTIVA
jgi:F0F1-type ATP synthase epsilon subunit